MSQYHNRPMSQYHNLPAAFVLPTLSEPIFHNHLYVLLIKEIEYPYQLVIKSTSTKATKHNLLTIFAT